VKKIALTLVAVSALGLAACQNSNEAAVNNVAADAQNAIDQATQDIANAQDAATNLLDAAANQVEQAGEAAENATDAATSEVANATK
jgi:hypothetical protein